MGCGTDNYNISPQFFCQLIDFIPTLPKRTCCLMREGSMVKWLTSFADVLLLHVADALQNDAHRGKTVQAQAG